MFKVSPSTYLHFKREVLLHILDDEAEMPQFDAERLACVGRTGDVR